jgi:hypothetical protein
LTRSPHSTSPIVQLVTRRPRPGQPADSEFFTTWATLEEGDWKADKVSQLLQLAPNIHFGARPFAQEFHVTNAVDVARSFARSNEQYGSGGGEKLFIPAAKHPNAIAPVGDLIPLFECSSPPAPVGFIKRLLEVELSLGNKLVGSDKSGPSQARSRFWLQEPLHREQLGRLGGSASVFDFEDLDMHGKTTGVVSRQDSQVVVAPFREPPAQRSWFARLFS